MLCCSLPLNVHAYIDPATTTYVIQIVSAIVITVGITIGVFFGRIRMFLLNARVRMTEWQIRLFSKKQVATAVPAYARFLSRVQPAPMGKWEALWHDERSYGQRLVIALCIGLGLVFTFGVFGPYEKTTLVVNSGSRSLRHYPHQRDYFYRIGFGAGGVGKYLMLSSLLLVFLAGYIRESLNTGLGQLTGFYRLEPAWKTL